MSRICMTSLKRNILYGLMVVLILAVGIALFVLMLGVEPDHHDSGAVVGTPTVTDEARGYRVYSAPGVCDVGLCGEPRIEGRDVYLYLTNPASNTVSLKIEFFTPLMVQQANGSYEPVPDVLLGESEFIRPGEYVEIVRLKKALADEKTNVMMKVSTLNEEEERSEGFFYVNTVFTRGE